MVAVNLGYPNRYDRSNLARPRSGHLYFSLKDESSQVRCAMFRTRNRNLDFIPEDGMHVLLHAEVSLYAERGDFQLIVQYMEEAGAGALRRAFDALKHRLSAEDVGCPFYSRCPLAIDTVCDKQLAGANLRRRTPNRVPQAPDAL